MVEGLGYIYAEKQIEPHNDPLKIQPMGTYRIERNPITLVEKNGEMALVNWYAQGDKEWNGKYVVQIEYYPELTNNL